MFTTRRSKEVGDKKWREGKLGGRLLEETYSDNSETIAQPTCWGESQLPADHTGIKSIPGIIANGAPYIVDAQLDSTFINV